MYFTVLSKDIIGNFMNMPVPSFIKSKIPKGMAKFNEEESIAAVLVMNHLLT